MEKEKKVQKFAHFGEFMFGLDSLFENNVGQPILPSPSLPI